MLVAALRMLAVGEEQRRGTVGAEIVDCEHAPPLTQLLGCVCSVCALLCVLGVSVLGYLDKKYFQQQVFRAQSFEGEASQQQAGAIVGGESRAEQNR